MKYLLLLLLTFNVLAVERLIVTQVSDGGRYHNDHASVSDALENLEGRILGKKWMKCDWLDNAHPQLSLSRSVIEQGSLDTKTVYCHPKSFTYSIVNIDQDLADEAQAEADKDAEEVQVRAMLQDIGSWDIPPKHKQLLRHLIRQHHR